MHVDSLPVFLTDSTTQRSTVQGVVRCAVTHSPAWFRLKRATDLVLVVPLLLLLLPVLLIVAVAVKLDSPGPCLFVQERVGARRRKRADDTVWELCTFPMFKFRSMVHGADPTLHRAHIQAFVEERLDTRDTVKLTGDPRITRVGRLIRRTSLDELPQLLNVLRGEMSLVGPRPVPIYEAAAYLDWHRERLAALPGITGLWQVKGRGVVSFTEMVRMDIEYVRRQSFLLDLEILLSTLPAVVSGRGAG
jgi:lipopolysaccharide/colanic/teichoic acid biosynthesis glycosyltransferase